MFAAIVEIGTGLALLIDPRFVVSLLIGTNLPIGEIANELRSGLKE